MKRPSKAKLEALDLLIRETAALSHRLRAAAAETHGAAAVSPGLRDVMLLLAEQGPQTVPQMALSRAVSRQHIQTVVNRLVQGQLVALLENPAHKRSNLVSLTKHGRQALSDMSWREQELLGQLPIGVSKKELRAAAGTLQAVRELFEGQQWRSLVQGDVAGS